MKTKKEIQDLLKQKILESKQEPRSMWLKGECASLTWVLEEK